MPAIPRKSDEPAAVAAPVARNSFARRAGLATQVEIHDQQQVEVRFNYALAGGVEVRHYEVDAYFFIPRSVGLYRGNFSRDQFYGDVTALMRMDAAPLPLDRLADPAHPASPLARLTAALARFRAATRPPESRPIALEVKLYAHLCSVGVRSEVRRLDKQLARAQARGAPAEWQPAFLADLAAALGRVRAALAAFRRFSADFRPFERLAHRSVADALRAADEYMSLFVEERLALLVVALERDPRGFDGSGFVPRARLAVAALAAEEAAYRVRASYLTLTDRALPAGEYFTYRASQLKKSVQNALYLDPRAVRADAFARNAASSVAAALAAIWALATQLPRSLPALSAGTQLAFFFAAVLAYVTKDRIKSVAGEYLVQRVRKYDHAATLHGEALAAVGLGRMRIGLRESVRFVSSTAVPAEVLQMRLRRRTVHHAESTAEEVVHYRKEVDVRLPGDRAALPDGYRVRDILRVNVRHFLVRLDDPLDRVTYFDARRNRFAAADLPKVYHVNIVLRVRRRDAGGEGHERMERLRLVINKDGIVRVEKVESEAPAPFVHARRRLGFRLRRRG